MEQLKHIASDDAGTSPSKHNAAIGYQTAISLLVNEGNMMWAKFNAMLVANGILIAAIAMGGVGQTVSPWISWVLPFAGLLICFFWFLLTERAFSYAEYWMAWAKNLEAELSPVNIVRQGKNLPQGTKVADDSYKVCNGPWGIFRARWIARLVEALFAIVYVLFLLF